jgi:hypothetical protein
MNFPLIFKGMLALNLSDFEDNFLNFLYRSYLLENKTSAPLLSAVAIKSNIKYTFRAIILPRKQDKLEGFSIL